jgi:hypothetical protein
MSVECQGQAKSLSVEGRDALEATAVGAASTVLIGAGAVGALALSGGWWPW